MLELVSKQNCIIALSTMLSLRLVATNSAMMQFMNKFANKTKHPLRQHARYTYRINIYGYYKLLFLHGGLFYNLLAVHVNSS